MRIPIRAISLLTLSFIQHQPLPGPSCDLSTTIPSRTPTLITRPRELQEVVCRLSGIGSQPGSHSIQRPRRARQPILEAEVYKEHIRGTCGKEKEALRVSVQRQSQSCSEETKTDQHRPIFRRAADMYNSAPPQPVFAPNVNATAQSTPDRVLDVLQNDATPKSSSASVEPKIAPQYQPARPSPGAGPPNNMTPQSAHSPLPPQMNSPATTQTSLKRNASHLSSVPSTPQPPRKRPRPMIFHCGRRVLVTDL